MSNLPSTSIELVVFDVNETLSDMRPLAGRFADLGAPPELAAVWFAGLLRDGFALTVAGTMTPFADLARAGLRSVFDGVSLDRDRDAAVDHVMSGFLGLGVHPDVAPGFAALADAGVRMVTLSNGAASVAEGLLDRAGLAGQVEQILSVEDAGIWKPAPAAYHHALAATGVAAERAMLVAVHPWDTDGARRAGLRAGWLNRTGADYPGHFLVPEVQAGSLPELAQLLS